MRILITGTTGGIGGAVRRAALAAGHEVVEMNRGGFDCPLTGTFDAVVFATGTCPVKSFAQLTDGEWAETMEANCGLFVRLMRRFAGERLFAPTGAKVVAVSSVSAVEGWAGGSAYCASKGALSALCRALDAEWRSRRISVVALEPRYVKTRMFDACAGRMGVSPALAQEPDAFARELMDMLENDA